MDSKEAIRIRVRAAGYAHRFLAAKYKEEYRELYDAYLINRGIKVRSQHKLIDERTVEKVEDVVNK